MNEQSKIFIAGHNGMVGSAIHRLLQRSGYENIITRNRGELDLCCQKDVESFFRTEKPEYVFLAAARVGGIWANDSFPAEFIYQNISIQNNIIHFAYQYGVEKLLFLGSSCIYPKLNSQPMHEDSLLTGPLEPTNEAYAIAKISGVKMCQFYSRQYQRRFISAMPTNLYGPKDNFDLKTSHVLPALIRKFHEAKISQAPYVEVWGTGKAMREFLHVDDLAEACLFLMCHYEENTWINVGTGEDLSIKDLATTIQEVVGYSGSIKWNTQMPDGTPRKLLNVEKIQKLGWKAKTSLSEGISNTYRWFLDNQELELDTSDG